MSQYIYTGIQIIVVVLGFISLYYVVSKKEVKNRDTLAAASLAAF